MTDRTVDTIPVAYSPPADTATTSPADRHARRERFGAWGLSG
jgi:hypothetical protein